MDEIEKSNDKNLKKSFAPFNVNEAFAISADIPFSHKYNKLMSEMCDGLYRPIAMKIGGSKPHKAKEALKIIILNIQRSRLLYRPIYYSRRKNDYYNGHLFSTLPYHSIIWAIDGLTSLGLIIKRKGFYGKPVARKSFYSRFWASESLIALLDKIKFPLILALPEDFIPEITVFYKKNGVRHPAPQFSKKTKASAKPALAYNDYITNHKLIACIDRNADISIQYFSSLLSDFITGKKTVFDVQTKGRPKKSLIDWNMNFFNKIKKISDAKGAMEHTWIRFLSLITENLRCSKAITPEALFKLSDIGIDQITYRINTLYLHRVFSDEKLTLDGRFYQDMTIDSESKRKKYRFDGMEVAEPDFQGMLARLAYHSKGIDYREDPYSQPLGIEYREAVKTALLFAFNCVDYKDALKTFRAKAKEKGFKLPSATHQYAEVFYQIEEKHSAIRSLFYNGGGIQLRNIESKIMGNILLQLINLDMPTMPIHDGLVVPKKDLEVVIRIMKVEYQKVTGFQPVIQ